jgi:hypothetical protein
MEAMFLWNISWLSMDYTALDPEDRSQLTCATLVQNILTCLKSRNSEQMDHKNIAELLKLRNQ